MNRRLTAVLATLAIAGSGLGIAISSAASHGGAATTTWYQCINNGGKIEAKNGGTTIPTCAHATDTILQWQVNVGTLPPTTTTPPTAPPPTVAPITVPPTTPPTIHLPPPVILPSWWTPTADHSMPWWDQQTGVVALQPQVKVYDEDWSSTTPVQVASQHVSDAKSVCQIDAGAWEPARPDAGQFPAGAIGLPDPFGGPGAKWLDVRDATIRGIEEARIEHCKQSGFDAVDFTNVDGFANISGFPLTSSDQLIYNTFLADTAHKNGLAAGLNEDRSQIAALQPSFDFGVAEEAQFLGQAGDFAGFTNVDKAVFDVEFVGSPALYCPQDAFDHINGLRGDFALDGIGYFNCPAW